MQIIMPKLGLTMTHGTITEWLKTPGDRVEAEAPLAAYETEKVSLELAAPEDGVLVEILVPVGVTVPAGAPVCEFRPDSERRASSGAAAARDGVSATPKARALARERGVDLSHVAGSGPAGRVQAGDVLAMADTARRAPAGRAPAGRAPAGRAAGPAPAPPAPARATRLARRIAAAEGIDLDGLRGSGAGGTVTREDVERALERRRAERRGAKPTATATGREAREGTSGGAPSGDMPSGDTPGAGLPTPAPEKAAAQVIPHSMLRRTIGERMSRSASTAPHVTLMTEAEATNLVSARSQLNLELPAADRIGYNALFAALAARALREHPGVNARWEPDGIHLLPEINIALAVDTERGLMTPVLRGVDRLSLDAVQRGYAALIGRALAGQALPEDFTEGTFTITNLGAWEIDGFTPIINPPQAAILGVGRIADKPVARDAAVVIRQMVTLSLSFDHRAIDGGPAGRFLQRVKQLVERPMALLLCCS